MAERKITAEEAGIYRIQAVQETLLKLICESLAIQHGKDPAQILGAATKDIDASVKELLTMHSRLSGDQDGPSAN